MRPEVGGHGVNTLEMGEGPLAIFAHCSLAHAGLWAPVMKLLSDRWRCIALDLPGHGRTDRGDPALSLQEQAARDVAAIAARHGEPAHLVGLSLGGAIMGRVAARRPEIARSLTLIEPIYFYLVAGKRPEMIADNQRVMGPVIEACAAGRYRDGARLFMEGWGQPGQFDRFPEAAKQAVAAALVHVSADFDMAHGRPPGQVTEAELSAIALPTLLLEGARTPASAAAIQDELAGLMPAAARTVIPDAGHLSPVDNPAAVAARLAAHF